MNKKFKFKKFIYALAPMAGVTDFAFREICCNLGADMVVSEMVSAKALEYNNARTQKMLKENGDKISAEDKEKLEKSIEKAKEQFKSDDADTIRKAMEELSKENEPIVNKLYQEAQEKAQANNAQNGSDEVIVEDPDKK